MKSRITTSQPDLSVLQARAGLIALHKPTSKGSLCVIVCTPLWLGNLGDPGLSTRQLACAGSLAFGAVVLWLMLRNRSFPQQAPWSIYLPTVAGL